jgi:hypothetical protein
LRFRALLSAELAFLRKCLTPASCADAQGKRFRWPTRLAGALAFAGALALAGELALALAGLALAIRLAPPLAFEETLAAT